MILSQPVLQWIQICKRAISGCVLLYSTALAQGLPLSSSSSTINIISCNCSLCGAGSPVLAEQEVFRSHPISAAYFFFWNKWKVDTTSVSYLKKNKNNKTTKKPILLAYLKIKSAHLVIKSNNMTKDTGTVRTYNVRLFQKRNCCLQPLKLQCNLDFRLFQPLNRSFNQSMVVPVPASHHRSCADLPSSLWAAAPVWAWIPQVGTNRAYRYWWDLLQSTDCCPVPTVSKEQAVCWRKQGVLDRKWRDVSKAD